MAWAPDYVTAEELRDYVDIGDLDDDTEIGLAVAAASRAVDYETNRQFGKAATVEQRFYTARPDYGRGCGWTVDVDDFQTVTGLVVAVAANPVATFVKAPANATVEGRPWTRIRFTSDSEAQPTGDADEVAVTALWGWTAVPVQVKQATVIQANRLLKRRHAPFGVAGSPDTGSELRLLAKIDPDVAVSLRGLRRPRTVG